MKRTCLLALLVIASWLYAHEKYVTVDSQKYRVKEMGQGNITVVFESGMSDSIENWQSIPDSIAKIAKVFLYDRPGIGKSDSATTPRTLPNHVKELHDLLNYENIHPPYVFVGHSLGGFITRYYISQHPEQVKGLLLLDPAAEAWWYQMSAKELQEYKKGGDEVYRSRPRGQQQEWEEFLPNMEYMRNLKIPEQIPVILISASAWEWYKYHKKIIKGHKNSKHVELTGSHYIHQDHPDKTIQYIKDLLQTAGAQ
ncbi:MAG TPA: alpha/beta hydrolase [bacterium]|nr:alpha/beta hydrolase [bacterium]HPN45732.1 alpha/beta hydrolase [bacterium]